MRNILISVCAVLLIASSAYSQGQRGDLSRFDRFIPITLTAGTAMSGRTDAQGSTLDDTTRSIDIRGFSYVGVSLVTATNDSASALVSWRGNTIGSSWSALDVIDDSLSTSGTVGVSQHFVLPDAALAYDNIQVRVYGSDSALHSANPSSTITTYIVRRY